MPTAVPMPTASNPTQSEIRALFWFGYWAERKFGIDNYPENRKAADAINQLPGRTGRAILTETRRPIGPSQVYLPTPMTMPTLTEAP